MKVAAVTTKLESGWLHGGTRQLRSGSTEWDRSQNLMPPCRENALHSSDTALTPGQREYSGDVGGAEPSGQTDKGGTGGHSGASGPWDRISPAGPVSVATRVQRDVVLEETAASSGGPTLAGCYGDQ